MELPKYYTKSEIQSLSYYELTKLCLRFNEAYKLEKNALKLLQSRLGTVKRLEKQTENDGWKIERLQCEIRQLKTSIDILLKKDEANQKLNKHMSKEFTQIIKQNNEITKLLQEKDGIINTKDNLIKQKDEMIKQKNEMIENLEIDAIYLNYELKEKKEYIDLILNNEDNLKNEENQIIEIESKENEDEYEDEDEYEEEYENEDEDIFKLIAKSEKYLE